MSWTAFHSRGETLHAVVDAANATQDGILPLQVPGVAENFTDEVDLVGALLLKWHARLSGNIERALMREPMDLESAVSSAWRATAEQLPGVRLVIDRCTLLPETTEMAEGDGARPRTRVGPAGPGRRSRQLGGSARGRGRTPCRGAGSRGPRPRSGGRARDRDRSRDHAFSRTATRRPRRTRPTRHPPSRSWTGSRRSSPPDPPTDEPQAPGRVALPPHPPSHPAWGSSRPGPGRGGVRMPR